MTWPPMIWIGGTQGSGKTTLGRHLAHTHDLPLHAIDAWTYDHASRLPPVPALAEQLAAGPEAAADVFARVGLARLPLVVDDIRSRDFGDVPALVEGPQLLPSMAGLLGPGHAVWLLTDPEQTRRARLGRGGSTERVEALVRRDAIHTERLRRGAADAGLAVIEVPTDPDWGQVAAAVERALAPALAAAPRLTPGPELSRQRRFENRTVARQLRLWAADAGLTEPPSFAFSCECGASGCEQQWEGTAEEYAAGTQSGPLLVAGHEIAVG